MTHSVAVTGGGLRGKRLEVDFSQWLCEPDGGQAGASLLVPDDCTRTGKPERTHAFYLRVHNAVKTQIQSECQGPGEEELFSPQAP